MMKQRTGIKVEPSVRRYYPKGKTEKDIIGKVGKKRDKEYK
ncbi:hypothetical protein, partial [Chlamydia psittaci]